MYQPAHSVLVFNWQKYIDDARLFTDALSELQAQVSKIEASTAKARQSTTPSTVMKSVMQKAPSPALTAYIKGELAGAPQPDLARQIDENCRLLRVLCKEMESFSARIASVQAALRAGLEQSLDRCTALDVPADVQEDDTRGNDETDEELRTVDQQLVQDLGGSAQVALIAASLADGIERDLDLVKRVAAAVTVLSPAEEIGAYEMILRAHPYIDDRVLETVLSWRQR
jgi:hypothetical protein